MSLQKKFKDKDLSTDATPFSFSYKGYKIHIINALLYASITFFDFKLKNNLINEELKPIRRKLNLGGPNVGRTLKVKNNPEAFKNKIREIFTELIAADEVEKEVNGN